MGLVPSYISRSVAGSYDYEATSIFAMLFTFYLWVKVAPPFSTSRLVREHWLVIHLRVLRTELLLHGVLLGWLRVHHQSHPHLRRGHGVHP